MWPNLHETVNLVAFTVEILNGKSHFLCNDKTNRKMIEFTYSHFILSTDYVFIIFKILIHRRKLKLLGFSVTCDAKTELKT